MILGVLQSVVSKYMVYYKSKAGQIFSFSNKSCGVPVDLLAIKFVFELRLYKKIGKETVYILPIYVPNWSTNKQGIIIYFVYLEPDPQHVWDMNPASNFDAGNAQLLML